MRSSFVFKRVRKLDSQRSSHVIMASSLRAKNKTCPRVPLTPSSFVSPAKRQIRPRRFRIGDIVLCSAELPGVPDQLVAHSKLRTLD